MEYKSSAHDQESAIFLPQDTFGHLTPSCGFTSQVTHEIENVYLGVVSALDMTKVVILNIYRKLCGKKKIENVKKIIFIFPE